MPAGWVLFGYSDGSRHHGFKVQCFCAIRIRLELVENNLTTICSAFRKKAHSVPAVIWPASYRRSRWGLGEAYYQGNDASRRSPETGGIQP